MTAGRMKLPAGAAALVDGTEPGLEQHGQPAVAVLVAELGNVLPAVAVAVAAPVGFDAAVASS